jgi:hypothetical protein
LLEALEAMADDNQSIAPRAMILNRKYRTLVSSWIEPLQEEADVGFEIDYVARYDFVMFVTALCKSILVAHMTPYVFSNDGLHIVFF